MTRQVRWPRRVNRPPISGLRMRTRRQCPSGSEAIGESDLQPSEEISS